MRRLLQYNEYEWTIRNEAGVHATDYYNSVAFAFGFTKPEKPGGPVLYRINPYDSDGKVVPIGDAFMKFCQEKGITVAPAKLEEKGNTYFRVYGWMIDNITNDLTCHVVRKNPDGTMEHKRAAGVYSRRITEEELHEMYPVMQCLIFQLIDLGTDE